MISGDLALRQGRELNPRTQKNVEVTSFCVFSPVLLYIPLYVFENFTISETFYAVRLRRGVGVGVRTHSFATPRSPSDV